MKPGDCIHNNGSLMNKVCKAGVKYSDVTPGWRAAGNFWRQPCHRSEPWGTIEAPGPRGTCDKYETLPDAEIEKINQESIAEFKALIDFVVPLSARIKAEHPNESWMGVEECPKCGGKLHVSIAACNGHVHGRCEKHGCLFWME